jgi:DHA3 family macrolide efflux protein-like MFS transporter
MDPMTTATVTAESKNWKRPFFTVWIGQAFSLLGSQLVQFALIWYLTQSTGSATVLAQATLAGMLPHIVLSPFTGSFVDRGNRRRIMMVADSSIAFATLILAVLFYFGVQQVWHIYLLIFLRSLGNSFHQPAFLASTSLMVPKEHLARIQGVNQTIAAALGIFAAPLGALLLALVPMQGILSIDMVTAVIAVTPLFFIKVPQPEPQTNKEGKRSTYWEDFRAGFRYVFSWPGMLILIVMSALINFFFSPTISLIPLLVRNYFGGGAVQLSYVEVAFGVGAVVGGLILGTWGGFKRRIVTEMLGLIGLGAGVLFVSFAPPTAFWIAIVGMAVGGLMVPIVNGSEGAILQDVVEPGMQGRVFNLSGALSTASTPLSLLIAGPLADRFGILLGFRAAGSLCIAMGTLGLFLPALMNVEKGKPVKTKDPPFPRRL